MLLSIWIGLIEIIIFKNLFCKLKYLLYIFIFLELNFCFLESYCINIVDIPLQGSILNMSTSSINIYGAGSSEADKPLMAELAVTAMKELVKMAQAEAPLWIRSTDNTVQSLSEDEYFRNFPGGIGPKDMGLKSEASRYSTVILMDHIKLVEIMMDVVCTTYIFLVVQFGIYVHNMPN